MVLLQMMQRHQQVERHLSISCPYRCFLQHVVYLCKAPYCQFPAFSRSMKREGFSHTIFFSFSKKRSEKNLASLNWKGMNNTILITVPWITFQSCPSDNFHALRSSASLLLLKNYTHSYFSCLPSSFLSFFLAQHIK